MQTKENAAAGHAIAQGHRLDWQSPKEIDREAKPQPKSKRSAVDPENEFKF